MCVGVQCGVMCVGGAVRCDVWVWGAVRCDVCGGVQCGVMCGCGVQCGMMCGVGCSVHRCHVWCCLCRVTPTSPLTGSSTSSYRQWHATGELTEVCSPFHTLLRCPTPTPTSCSNLLLNVGPTADGRIDPIFEERLLDIGAWLEVSGRVLGEERGTHP